MKSFCFVTPEKYLKTVERLFLTATDKAEVPLPYYWSLQLCERGSVKKVYRGNRNEQKREGQASGADSEPLNTGEGRKTEIAAHCHIGVTDWVKNNDCILVQWQLDISEYTNT